MSALLRGGRTRLNAMAQNPAGLSVPTLGLILSALTELQRRDEKFFKRCDPKPPPRRRKK